MEENKELLETILARKTEDDCIVKVLKLESKPATSKGDNFVANVKKVSMEVLLKSGKKMKKTLIIKEQPNTEYLKNMLEDYGLFRIEIMMYRDVLPSMEDIMREFGDYTEFMWGSLLHYTMYDKLILHDLNEEGYILQDRKQGLNVEHCKVVMRSLAKFHATSVLMKQRGLICIEMFAKHVFENNYCQQLNEKFQSDVFIKLANLIDTWGTEWGPVAEKIRTEISPNVMKKIVNLMKTDKNKFSVLCHGDCWINNMLFKYGLDGKTPISVKFIDFQLSFFNSPAFDLQYFLASSSNIEVRKHSLPELIKVYHETLLNQLELYSYEGPTITLESLNEEMKRIELFGIYTSISILPVALMENSELAPNMEELVKNVAENDSSVMDNWKEFHNPSPRYLEIVNETISQSIKNNSLLN